MPSTPEPKFYVSPPQLASAKKRQYVPAKDVQSLKEDARVDEVIGEYYDPDKGLFYFARYAGGIAHKFPALEFEGKYDALVKAYRAKKRANELPQFDPNATYVHPLSRLKAKNGKPADISSRSSRASRSVEAESVPDSEEEASTDGDDEDDEAYEDEEDDDARTPPRVVRPTTRKELPYSPRKTRTRHVAVIDSDSETSAKSSQKNLNLRRSTRARKAKKKGKKRKRGTDDEFEASSDDEDTFMGMGGWVQCLKCAVSAHWKCLASTQRDEVLRAAKERDRQALQASSEPDQQLVVRRELKYNQITEFLCGACSRGGICNGCAEDVSLPAEQAAKDTHATSDPVDNPGDSAMDVDTPDVVHSLARELLFRCLTCKRPSHYRHLPSPGEDDYDLHDIAQHYQKRWLCADCISYTYNLDKIIAWRPYPPTAVEKLAPGETPHYKNPLPREYLVKWEARSYRRLDWVPHMWLVSTSGLKLKNFLSGGTKVELLKQAEEDEAEPTADFLAAEPGEKEESRASSVKAEVSPFDPLPDAEKLIPRSWKTIDRVLDVVMWIPDKYLSSASKGRIRKENGSTSETKRRAMELASEKGEAPADELTWTSDQWHDEVGTLTPKNRNVVAWAFIKWEGLGYDECTWDAPPREDEPGYAAFIRAFERYLAAQKVFIPKQTQKYWDLFDKRAEGGYGQHQLERAEDLDLGQGPKLNLMPFQVDGFNWLCNNWWNHQPCILADEMGLGKTVQIVTFLGNIIASWNALPALVVVPNSTIINWVREFERWAPTLRVVPFNGEKPARDVLKDYELFHKTVSSDKTKAKFHVLVTTYETLTATKDFTSVFKNQPRWEVLVVDEGQRLKSDSSLLFRKLNELNTAHRIIMTGTPLNNNIRELFNLMNFLDPKEWSDLAGLEKEHETLSEELIKQLHSRLRPYFLRRIKSEVLDLPPKNEVIVPVSMAPLQREVYKSILTHNLNILNGLAQPVAGLSAPAKSRINNVLMQLRKCLQHPYLYAEDIEPRNLGPSETHEKLIDGSAKLRFLKALLPRLKERGHRVLLFSQFVIALNIVEDFLNGEGYKFLRLDGNTKSGVRQKMMDEYNKPGSEYFIFLLTTRAGGVGINLFSADTVIIFDPDFNPHQDLQAIARAYRYGQQKTCLVFKLMVKESAEERIMQIGKKKLVLDHLIVQKMDDNDDNGGEDVQSILTYGAQALFESEESSREINYSDQDIVKLIDKTEKEAVKETSKASGGLTFSFAKIWAADKDSLDEVVEGDQKDSWAQALARLNAEAAQEKAKEEEEFGKRGNRKAAAIAKSKIKISENAKLLDTPKIKIKVPVRVEVSDDSVYAGSDHGDQSSIENDSDHAMMSDDLTVMNGDPKKRNRKALKAKADLQNYPYEFSVCGLCQKPHGPGECSVKHDSKTLAEFREMLMNNAEEEPWESRRSAIEAIDEELHARGDIALIAGQPLHPLRRPIVPPALPSNTALPAKTKNVASSSASASVPRKAMSSTIPNSQMPAPAPASAPVPQKRTHQAASLSTNAVASSSTLVEPFKKKLKTGASAGKCPLCGSHQGHALANCPIVLAGAASILDQIVLLEGRLDPSSIALVQQLRPLLKQARSNGPSMSSSMPNLNP